MRKFTIKSMVINKRQIKQLLLIAVLVTVAAVNAQPATKAVFNLYAQATARKLPIYSVDTPEQKISISFDAAWGDGK